jgi:nucleoside 2-deoxyribosyltransferase
MTGLTWREALEWREDSRILLPQWDLINPCRTQVPKGALDELIVGSTQEDKDLELTCTATGIVAQDLFFVDQSDWLFCNFLHATQISFGSAYEMGYARRAGKKILSVINPGSMHDQAFARRGSDIFTPSFEEAIDFFQTIAV